MGDLMYEGQVDGQKDLFPAAEMYKLAALRNNPQVRFISIRVFCSVHIFFQVNVSVSHTVLLQGWYSLGRLAEEGYRLPLSVLSELGLSELYLADTSFLLSILYKRCVCILCVYVHRL